MKSVGAYEAKTHLPELLGEVAEGKSVIITKHGVPVAKLIPVQRQPAPASEVIAALRNARRGVTVGGLSLRELISESRH